MAETERKMSIRFDASAIENPSINSYIKDCGAYWRITGCCRVRVGGFSSFHWPGNKESTRRRYDL